MIILISGFSRTGKTLMAQKLMEKYKITYMSVDHIKMGLYRGLGDEKYNPEQKDTILGASLWPIIKGIIYTAIENDQNLIIEGCYILPYMVNDIELTYKRSIIPVFIGFSKNYIRNNYQDKIIGFQNIIEKRESDELDKAEYLFKSHNELKLMCENENVKYFEINEEYELEMNDVYNYVGGEIIKLSS